MTLQGLLTIYVGRRLESMLQHENMQLLGAEIKDCLESETTAMAI